MNVDNDHVGVLILTTHAVERWAERGACDETLVDVLKRAMPFGGQFGDSMLLADGEIVFATKTNGFGDRVVVTVLTKDQAIANMQESLGFKAYLLAETEPANAVKSKPAYVGGLIQEATPGIVVDERSRTKAMPKLKLSKRKKLADPLAELESLYQLPDDELMAVLPSLGGTIRQLVQREVGHRSRLKKYIAHAQRMDQDKNDIVNAMREVLSPAQVEAVFQHVQKLREAQEGKADV